MAEVNSLTGIAPEPLLSNNSKASLIDSTSSSDKPGLVRFYALNLADLAGAAFPLLLIVVRKYL